MSLFIYLYIFHNSHKLQIEIYEPTLILLIYVIPRKDIVIRRKDLVRNYEYYLIITKKISCFNNIHSHSSYYLI